MAKKRKKDEKTTGLGAALVSFLGKFIKQSIRERISALRSWVWKEIILLLLMLTFFIAGVTFLILGLSKLLLFVMPDYAAYILFGAILFLIALMIWRILKRR